MIGKAVTWRGLALAGALALAVGACGGASATAAPAASSAGGGGTAATPAGGGAATPAATPAASTAGGVSGDAIGALSDLNSYKIKFVMAGKGTSGGLASMGNISMEGIVVLKPEKASDITMTLGAETPGDSSGVGAMKMRILEVNGKQYTDLGGGTLTESTDTSGTSMADSLSPEKMLGGASSYMDQMQKIGDESKNGVETTHYKADDKVLSSAATYLDLLGLKDAKWNWEIWVAKQGGYIVSYVMTGTGSDSSEMTLSLDISDVNSPANVVKAP